MCHNVLNLDTVLSGLLEWSIGDHPRESNQKIQPPERRDRGYDKGGENEVIFEKLTLTFAIGRYSGLSVKSTAKICGIPVRNQTRSDWSINMV